MSPSDRHEAAAPSALTPRLAASPYSWGVRAVPGVEVVLPVERVLGEMAGLGLRATELGSAGYLPLEPDALRETLDAHGLRLISGFASLALHGESWDEARATAHEIVRAVAGAGGELFVIELVGDDVRCCRGLHEDAWVRLRERYGAVARIADDAGLRLALHPHTGSLVESEEDIARLAEHVEDVDWCLDTGHILLGGWSPAAFVREYGDRIVHVHLKDVDAQLAERLRAGELTLLEASQAGLIVPLGQGDCAIDETLGLLDDHGYDGWLVIEQPAALAEVPAEGEGPVAAMHASVEHVADLERERERAAAAAAASAGRAR